uniref:Uncharacterized protein n=1 Tax=Hemiselmis andersenii TaxID=464988 RepID=A0A7S1E330_HEMAN
MYASVSSELIFKVKEFLFTFCAECLPLCLSGPLVTLFKGREEAFNRNMRPWFFTGMITDMMSGPGVWWVVICFYFAKFDKLPFSARYEVINLIIFIFARAAVLAIKYAFYPDKILDRSDKSIGIDSSNYEVQKVATKQQLACYVINADGRQRMQLVRILYQSMVHMDVDLSFSSVTFEDHGGFASRVWDEVVDLLKEAYSGNDEAPGLEKTPSYNLRHCASTDGHSASSDCHFGSGKQVEKEVMNGKGVLYDEDDSKLLKAFFREEGPVIAAKAARGELPTTVLAVYLVIRCFSWQQKWGVRVISSIFGISFILGFAPAFIRLGMGQKAMGEGLEVVVFNSLLCVSVYQGLAMFVWYNVGAALWFQSKLRLAREMQKLLDGDGETCGGGFKWCWEPSASHSEFHSVPRMDLRSANDVASWAAMRQVLSGGNFGPTIHRKIQFYSVIAMGVFVTLALVQSIGSFVAPERNVELSFRFYNIIRMVACISPVLAQTVLAYTINRYTGYAEEALYRAQRSIKGRAIDFRRNGCDEEAEEMNDAHDMLGAVGAEIRASEDAGPMRVLWLVATPEVVTLIGSFVTALLALELRDVAGSLPFA